MNTNYQTKKEASEDLKRVLESAIMLLKSKALITEFKNYAQTGNGIYNAKEGSTDDLISGCLIITRLLKYAASYDDEAFDRLYKSRQIANKQEIEEEVEILPMLTMF